MKTIFTWNFLILLSVIAFTDCSVHRGQSQNFGIVARDTIGGKFGLPLMEFELTVPLNYNHSSQIDSFVSVNYQTMDIIGYYADKYIKNATNKLVPGKTYIVKIFPILKKATSEECINFLIEQKAIFVNAQGLTLTYALKKQQLPLQNGWILSFDYKDSLPKSPDVKYTEYQVPMIGFMPPKTWQLASYSFTTSWDSNFACLLAFFEKPEVTR